jgi:hypothetical protein
MAGSLADLDPLFADKAAPKNAPAPAPRKRGHEEYTGPLPQIPSAPSEKRLEDLNEVFRPGPSAPAPAPGTTVDTSKRYTSPVSKESAALGGAGVGVALNRDKFAKLPSREARIQDLKITSQLERDAIKDVSMDIRALMTRQETLNIALDDAQRALRAAEAEALRYGAPTTAPDGLLPGDKWSAKTVGSMGPGGDATTEAARNYQIQKELTAAGEGAKFKASRTGLIVPNKPEFSGQFTSAAQENAYNKFIEAQSKYDATVQAANENKLALDKLNKTLGTSQTTANRAGQRAKMLEEMTTPGTFEKMGRFVKNIPLTGLLGGAATGYEGVQAYEAYKNQDIPGMIEHGMSATGGALMAVPHPVAKGLGLAISAPPLMYEAYKAMQDENPPPQQQTPLATPPAR